MIKDINQIIHEDLKYRLDGLLNCEQTFRFILYDVLSIGGAYIIGGFVRDVINDKDSRDLDVIVDIQPEELKRIVDNYCGNGYGNRMGGVKLKFQHVEVDIWSIKDNWAFANNLVKLNDKDKLLSIAKGCFFNYDALVVSIPKFMYNIRFYNEFVTNNELDIIQKQSIYQSKNPTVEANIIRAIFIKKNFGVRFSNNLHDYLYKEILSLQDKYGDALQRLMNVKEQYPKYQLISENDIKETMKELYISPSFSLFEENEKNAFFKT